MTQPQDLEREDVHATLETRRELGPAYETAVVDAFADRVEQAIEARVDARLAARDRELRERKDTDSKQMALGIVSLALGIPISAIAGGIADLPGLLVSWAGIVGVNASYAWQSRRHR